jgi:hypothetical protein
MRRQRQQIHAREQAAERATAATGIDPGELRAPAGRSMAAHLRGDASASVRAWELCKTAGTAHVARLISVHVSDLHAALAHWGLEVPKLRQPAEILEDPAAAREAFGLVEQVGWVKAARQVGVARRTLRAAFGRWGMGEPVYHGPCAPSRLVVDRAVAEEALELAIQLGMDRAAERFGVNPATLYNAWKRWGLGRPTDHPDGVRLARERSLAAKVIPDADHPGGPTARSGSRGGHLSGQPSGRSDPSAEHCPVLSAPRPTTQGRSSCPVWTGVRDGDGCTTGPTGA